MRRISEDLLGTATEAPTAPLPLAPVVVEGAGPEGSDSNSSTRGESWRVEGVMKSAQRSLDPAADLNVSLKEIPRAEGSAVVLDRLGMGGVTGSQRTGQPGLSLRI